MASRFKVCLLFLVALTSGAGLFGSDLAMKVTDKNYLGTQGFSVFSLRQHLPSGFVDQKNTAMEIILHGQRIGTNGDVAPDANARAVDLVATSRDAMPIRRTTGLPPTSLSRPSI